MARPQSRSYHHGDLKQALLDTSLDIIQKEGIHGLTLQKAARLQNVSAAAVYRHYASKEVLLAAIAEQGFRFLSTAVDPGEGSPARQADALFYGCVDAYIRLALSKPNHYELMFGGVITDHSIHPDLQKASRESFLGLVNMIRLCQREGVLRPGKPVLLAFHLWSQLHGFVMLQITGQTPFPAPTAPRLKRMIDRLERFLREGLDAPGGGSRVSP